MKDDRLDMIRQAVERLKVEPDQVIELRGLGVPRQYGKPATVAGWFNDADKLASAAIELEDRGAKGVYVTLNVVNPALLARAYNRLDEHPQAATSDADIIRRVWLPFDFDPVRPSGISATAEERHLTHVCTKKAVEWLQTVLNDTPAIWGDSGNGYHVLYRIDLPNDEAATAKVKQIIEETAKRFNDEKVTVDRTVFNAARIWKLYGTIARKGDEVPELDRVHRRSSILEAQEVPT